jgi:hypothetical protein
MPVSEPPAISLVVLGPHPAFSRRERGKRIRENVIVHYAIEGSLKKQA